MDLIQRPKKVQKAERGYLTNEKYQDYAESQFKTIYDYLDKLETPIDFSNEVIFNETPAIYHMKVVNGVAYVDYNGQAKAHTNGEVLFILPVGYRPLGSIFTPFIQGNVNGRIWINGDNGEVQISGISNTTDSTRVSFTISYLIN